MSSSQLEKFEKMLGYSEKHALSEQEKQELETIQNVPLPELNFEAKNMKKIWVGAMVLLAASICLVVINNNETDLHTPKGGNSLSILIETEGVLTVLGHDEEIEPDMPFVIKYGMQKGEKVYYGFFDGKGKALNGWGDMIETVVTADSDGQHSLGGTYSLDHVNVEESIVAIKCRDKILLPKLQDHVESLTRAAETVDGIKLDDNCLGVRRKLR